LLFPFWHNDTDDSSFYINVVFVTTDDWRQAEHKNANWET